MEEFSKQLLRQADLGLFSCPSGPAFARPGTSSLTVEADGRRLLSVCREVVLSTGDEDPVGLSMALCWSPRH